MFHAVINRSLAFVEQLTPACAGEPHADRHTNGIEGFWALVKRAWVGHHHHYSVKHMDRYLEKLEWRFNNHDNPHIVRDTLARIVNTRDLTYRGLIAT